MPTTTPTALAGKTPPQIIWEDPPATRGRLQIDSEVLASLRANPGRWALIQKFEKASSANSAAGRIRKGSIGAGFEARGVQRDGGSLLYVRYAGK